MVLSYSRTAVRWPDQFCLRITILPLLKPVTTTRLYVQIARQIADAVQQEQFKVGDRLPAERALAEELNVSRASVREALSALEILGIVESRSGNGTFIRRPPTEWTYLGTIFEEFVAREDSPHEVLEARRLLEPLVAQLAAERATPDQINQIALSLAALEQTIVNSAARTEADTSFHLAIATATGNSVLVRQVQLLLSAMGSQLWASLNQHTATDPLLVQKFLTDHQQIYQAIQRRNPSAAAVAMTQHIHNVAEDFFS